MQFINDLLQRNSQGPCQRWSLPLARANIWIFFAAKPQSSSISMKEQALLTDEVTCNCSVALTSQRKTCLLVHSEDSTNGSEFHSFEVNFLSLLFEWESLSLRNVWNVCQQARQPQSWQPQSLPKRIFFGCMQ